MSFHVLMGRGGRFNNFMFVTFVGRVSSDDVTNMAVKGLKWSALNAIITLNSL